MMYDKSINEKVTEIYRLSAKINLYSKTSRPKNEKIHLELKKSKIS